jgi:hypothetical protein
MSDEGRALAERIKKWRETDRAGYDEAIELLCEAEDALLEEQRKTRIALNMATKAADQVAAARAEGEAAGRAQEREDCAKVADEWRATYHEHAKDAHLRMLLNDASNYQQTAHLCESLAAAIRARAVGGGQ